MEEMKLVSSDLSSHVLVTKNAMADIVFLAVGVLAGVFLLIFLVTSLGERKVRASVVGGCSLFLFVVGWFGSYFFLSLPIYFHFSCSLCVGFLVILFFFSSRIVHSIRLQDSKERVDERDIVFTRDEYEVGTTKYEDYYSLHPGRKASDDKMRNQLSTRRHSGWRQGVDSGS